jgi:hypothetical protein
MSVQGQDNYQPGGKEFEDWMEEIEVAVRFMIRSCSSFLTPETVSPSSFKTLRSCSFNSVFVWATM